VRRGIAAGVAAALVFAAALVGGFGVLLQSALQAHGQLDRYAAAVAVVSGPQTVSQTVTRGGSQDTDSRPVLERDRVPVAESDRLRAVPGVRSVVADFSIPVVTRMRGELTGHGWDSAVLLPATLASGRVPTGADEVVLDAASAAELGGTGSTDGTGVKVGGTVVLQAGGGQPRPYLVSGLLSGDADAVYFSQAQAAALSGHPGSADALVVLGAPGTSTQALRAVAPGLVVATGAARGDVEDPAVAASRVDVIATSAPIGGVALLVVLLVVTGLLEMSVRDRTRELAVLRAVGATPRQVRRRIVRETIAIATPAAIVLRRPGCAAGSGRSRSRRSSTVSSGVTSSSERATSICPVASMFRWTAWSVR
jgi:putative ABC transport system permease protein